MENMVRYKVSELLTDEMKKKLDEPLDQEMISQRKGPGGKQLSYIEAYAMIEQANRIFGEGNWGFRVTQGPDLHEVPIWDSNGTISKKELFYTARVAVYLFGEKVFEDVGTNTITMPNDGRAPGAEAYETSYKGCVSDGLKRGLRAFGPQFGNSLYAGDEDGQIIDPNAPACPKHGAGRHVRESNRSNGYFCAHRDTTTETGFCDHTPQVPPQDPPQTREEAGARMAQQQQTRGQQPTARRPAGSQSRPASPAQQAHAGWGQEDDWGYVNPADAQEPPAPATTAAASSGGYTGDERDDMVERYVEIGARVGLDRGKVFTNFYKKFGKPITQATDAELAQAVREAEAIGA